MGNPRLLEILDDIKLSSFSETPNVRIKFFQQNKGTRYYRLKCEANTYNPSFPTTYLYLGSYTTDPRWNYKVSFPVDSVKNSSLQNISFEALFTQFPDSSEFRPTVHLQSSTDSSFPSNKTETSTESKLLSIVLVGDNFGPTWTCPTWVDEKYSTLAGVATLTESDQKGLQGVSRIRFNFTAASGRYGTTIDSYSVTVTGGFSHNLSPSHVSTVGTDYLSLNTYYKLVGDVTVTFTVTDSRGMNTVFTQTITIVPYKALYMTMNDTHRQGGTGSTVILSFSGRWYGSPLTLTCTGIEAKEEGSSGIFASLTPTITPQGSSFSYYYVWSGVSFDAKKAYTITATFTDTVRTVTLALPIPVGTPVLSIRNQRIGVNNPNPSANFSLDVNGIIAQNGYPVMGYCGTIGDSLSVDLNNYTETGFYAYTGESSDAYHFPSALDETSKLMLIVIATSAYRVQILYDVDTGARYSRTYDAWWSSWQ